MDKASQENVTKNRKHFFPLTCSTVSHQYMLRQRMLCYSTAKMICKMPQRQILSHNRMRMIWSQNTLGHWKAAWHVLQAFPIMRALFPRSAVTPNSVPLASWQYQQFGQSPVDLTVCSDRPLFLSHSSMSLADMSCSGRMSFCILGFN